MSGIQVLKKDRTYQDGIMKCRLTIRLKKTFNLTLIAETIQEASSLNNFLEHLDEEDSK